MLDPAAFNPTRPDTDQWCRTAQRAGMKYIVLVAKHHDGFCLWPTAFTDYSVRSTPFKGDVVGELADSARKHGLKFGLYYSLWDRHEPLHDSDEYACVGFMKDQLTELLTSYGEVIELWFDGFYLKQAKIDTLQPAVIIALQQGKELELLLEPLRHHPRIRLIELAPAESVRHRNMAERRDRRTERFSKAFRQAGLMTVHWTSLAVWPRPHFDTGRLVAFCDGNGFTRELGVVCKVHPAKRQITVKTTLRSLEGIFALRVGSVRLDLNSFNEKSLEKK